MSNVTTMESMFARNDGFNQDLDQWDVPADHNARNVHNLHAFNGDIGAWDVSNVVVMSEMFFLSTHSINTSAIGM